MTVWLLNLSTSTDSLFSAAGSSLRYGAGPTPAMPVRVIGEFPVSYFHTPGNAAIHPFESISDKLLEFLLLKAGKPVIACGLIYTAILFFQVWISLIFLIYFWHYNTKDWHYNQGKSFLYMLYYFIVKFIY
jgi:hypothetical protein